MINVFVDTMCFQYAASVKVINSTRCEKGVVCSSSGEKNDTEIIITEINILEKKANFELGISRDIEAINSIATNAKLGSVSLCYSHEVNLELLCQPAVDLAVGRLHGAPIKIIHSPLLKRAKKNFDSNDSEIYPLKIYPRNIVNNSRREFGHLSEDEIDKIMRDEIFKTPINSFRYGLEIKRLISFFKNKYNYCANTPKLFYPLLKKIKYARYREILNLLNVNGFSEKNKPNTYMDALHLWTAECDGCNIFMTLDKNIITRYKNPSLKVLKPRDVLKEIERK
ncbi:hypothetical protein [Zooshikella sp. RANM57]|uniref:hypothetical protein n=1 Tax=Zooshikella sp. RANM57 TaxID=3425863 RepID=UPI003D6F11EE